MPRISWLATMMLALRLVGCGEDGDGDGGSSSDSDDSTTDPGTDGSDTGSGEGSGEVSSGDGDGSSTGPSETGATECDYSDPGGGGCPDGTVQCLPVGPSFNCVPTDQAADCCCEAIPDQCSG